MSEAVRPLSTNEVRFIEALNSKTDKVRARFASISEQDCATPESLFLLLQEIKALSGNTSNDLSALSCILAKKYLLSRHDLAPYDSLAKAQGAAGIDIDVRTISGQRIIAEIKTTTPYDPVDFGAQQKAGIFKDLERLATTAADYKYMFVTDQRSFDLLQTRYQSRLAGISLVLLSGGVPETH